MQSNSMAKDYIKINSPLDLKYHRGNIVASYTYNHKTFRYNLFKVNDNNFLPKYSALRINPQEYDCAYEVSRMEDLLQKINCALIELSKTKKKDESITKKEVDEYIAELSETVTSDHSFIADFKNWIEEFKDRKYQEEVMAGKEPRKNHPTVKDYTSAMRLLEDFQYDNYDKPIYIEDLDNTVIAELISYCYDERVDTDEHQYNTEGNLTNKTINKRFDCIFTFIDNYYKKRPNGIIKPKLDTIQRKIIRLDRNELALLENLDLSDMREIKVRDYFLFLCYTGLRFSDFIRLDNTFYDKDANEIVLKATKTSAECRIFLFDKIKYIAQKYDFKFNDYSNQGLNRAIKELLDKYDLFPETIIMEYMQEGRKTKESKKRDLITCHAGRRTYISIMVESGLGLYELMSTTGHKKIDTLKFYIDRFGKSRREKFEKINNILNNTTVNENR